MLHQIAGHSIMRHDVHNAGPWTPHLSSAPFAPVVIMLDVRGLLPCRLVAASELGFQNVSPNCSRPTIIRQLLLAASGHLCAVSYHGTPWQPQVWCRTSVAPPPIEPPGRTPVLPLGCELFLFAAAHKTISRWTITNTCQPQQRTAITARVSVKVKTSITHTALALASELTSTLTAKQQQNCNVQMLTEALIVSEDDVNASFTEELSKASTRELTRTTLHVTIPRSNIDSPSCSRPSVCCSTVTDTSQTYIFNFASMLH